jgi:hypothetical protein
LKWAIREQPGYKDVRTTMLESHIIKRGGMTAFSPPETL